MKTLTIELSPAQHAAVMAAAKSLRISPETAVKALAFMELNTSFDNLASFRTFAAEVLDTMDTGNAVLVKGEQLAGCLR